MAGSLNSSLIGAKFFLNGFPKAGLHLIECLIAPFAREQKSKWITTDGVAETSWVPVFKDNAWSTEYERIQLTTYALGRVKGGHYLKGHMGHEYHYLDFMRSLGVIHIFIYRDPRDVAVSIAHELWYKKGQPGLSSQLGMPHPAKEEFRAMDSFDAVLSAVISGYKEYAGVMERWDYYFRWMTEDNVLVFRFEDVIQNPKAAAEKIVTHTATHMSRVLDVGVGMDPVSLDQIAESMAKSARETDRSVTFRAGRVGDWQTTFTHDHVEEFKETDIIGALVQLGYAEDKNWTI
jgi:hypothetical protein